MDLKERGVKFVSLRESIDTSTAMGRWFFTNLAALAELEREMIRERTLAGLAEVRAAGYILGQRLYGFELGSDKIIPEEAEVVKQIAKRVIAGETLRGIARDLNEAGIPTLRGLRWEGTTVRRTLNHDRIGQIIGHDQHFEVLQRLRARSERAGRPGTHLLSGFVFCGECSTPMYASRRQDGVWLYKCKKGQARFPNTCGRLNIVAEPLERYVVEQLWEHWVTVEEVTEDDTHEASMLVADLEAKLEDLAQRVRGGLSMEFALALEQGWREDLARARRQRDAAVRVVGYQKIPTDVAAWESSTTEEKRELLRHLNLKVTVKRVGKNTGHFFNPDRVEVKFGG
jgi:site-specific DNA recombinase